MIYFPLEEIQNYYNELDRVFITENIPTHFIFNVDESGFQDFCDSHKQYVIVPAESDEEQYYYSVDRSTKRITLIACICLDGSSIMPCIVSHNKTVEQELLHMGYNDSNCLIVYQESGFINAELFAYWADQILFKEIARRREQYNYHGTALLLMDNCTAHLSDLFTDECLYHGIYPFPEPPGSSDQVQALDLGIFGIQKKQRTRTRSNNLSATSDSIRDIVNSFRKATLPDNVVSAFNQAGIYIEVDNDNSRARASLEMARAVRGVDHVPCKNVLISPNSTVKLKTF